MEVLIAIFIMSIGMLAILALFPIGAVNMARAIQQDRGTTQGMNSDSTFRFYWAQSWRHPITGERLFSTYEAYGFSQEPMLYLLENHPAFGPIPGTSSQPSYPVLVDPVGWQTKLGTSDQIYVGDSNILPAPSPMPSRTTLRRCIAINGGYPLPWQVTTPPTPFAIPNPPAAYPTMIPVNIRLTTLLDDFTYDAAGQPSAPAGQIERGGRYNVSWLIRRPRMNVPDEITLHVLVYAGRSPTDTPSPEHTFPNAITGPGQKLIQFPLNGQPPPPLRKGAWVAYSRVIPPIPDPTNPMAPPTTTAYPTLDFYRVAGVNDDTAGQITVELDTAVRAEGPPPPLGPVNYTGTLIVFENLLEVFERGMLSAQGGSGR
jgi:hypothetical protein